ncbi:MAG: hypothetical protein K6E63_03820 [Lachnospiraceae bacterium]|nr:hypothetical protein [Lachnospiraceae bacterium]
MAGKVDISALNTPPEQYEFETAKYFAASGKDIVFICPSSIPNHHRPDIVMDGIEWEIKCPVGNSKRTIENNMRKALKQSHYVIFDLRHLKMSEKQAISQLEKEFERTSSLRKLYIIKKNGDLLVYPPKD